MHYGSGASQEVYYDSGEVRPLTEQTEEAMEGEEWDS